MKLSEFMKEAQELLDIHGDLDIKVILDYDNDVTARVDGISHSYFQNYWNSATGEKDSCYIHWD